MTTGIAGAALKEHGKLRAAEHDALQAKAMKLRAEGLTLKTIGERLSISPERVRELLKGRGWKEPRP